MASATPTMPPTDVRLAEFPRLQPPPPPAPSPEVRRAELAAELAALRERTRAEAFAAGREAGRGEGRTQAYADHAARLLAAAAAVEAAADEVRRRGEAAGAALEVALPRLAFVLAEKILGRALGDVTAAAESVVRDVAARIADGAAAIAVRVSAETLATLDAARGDAAAPLAGVRLVADPALGPGDWVLETRDGFFDGRVETQLAEAWRRLEDPS